MKGLMWGVLGLTFLDLILTSPLKVPDMAKSLAKFVEDWMNPAKPLLSQTASTKSSAGTAPTLPPIPPIQTASFGNPFPTGGGLPPFASGGAVNTGASISIT